MVIHFLLVFIRLHLFMFTCVIFPVLNTYKSVCNLDWKQSENSDTFCEFHYSTLLSTLWPYYSLWWCNRTFPPPKVVRKPHLSWLVVEQVAACMNTSINQFAGDTPGKRQSVSCCTKTQLQIVFYFIFCDWWVFFFFLIWIGVQFRTFAPWRHFNQCGWCQRFIVSSPYF
jgi:hypothetical protein